MNHIFRLIWNRRLGVLQVASEFARGHTKGGRSAEGGRRRAAWLAAVPLGLPLLAFAAAPPGVSTNTVLAAPAAVAASALPTGGKITSGAGQLAQQGNTLTITQQSQNLALNWQTFNIGSQSTVDFVQPDASAIAVNRIADTNGSQILGHLNANGQVFLINPNGVLFGQGAQVNVGGLVASTLDVNDSALGSGSLSFSGSGKGSVTNLGTLTAHDGGYVALLGNQVGNQGTIHAQLGSVALAGGSAVTLNFGGDKLVSVRVDQSTLNALAQNGQLIEANGGNVWMTAGARDSLLASAVNNSGTIEAQTVQNQNGHIMLMGGMDAGTVSVSGTLDASAPNGGNGGQIETSAASVNVANNTRITTAAAMGLAGTWLIDPITDFTIGPGKSGTVTGGVPTGDISGATLSAALNSGNVTIESSEGSTAGSGNVNVDDTVSWSAHTLTLDAQNNIVINAAMTASGTAGLALNYGGTNGSTSATPTAGTSIVAGLGSSNFAGKVNFTGANTLSINGTSFTLISTATALQGMTTSGDYALASNLTLSPSNFTPIGTSPTAFSGVFDGLGHTINGLTITNSSAAYVGLFGLSSGTIRNVGLVGGSVSGTGVGASIGELVGENSGAISNVFMTGTVSGAGGTNGGGEWVGGLVGKNDASGTIRNAFSTGAISGSSYLGDFGGLVGTNYGTISNAYATGSVSGSYGGTGATSETIGGLVGLNLGTIENTYATGSVSFKTNYTGTYGSSLGGLVGYGNGSVTDSYATGLVSSPNSSDHLGGLFGGVSGSATFTANYWDTQTTGQPLGASGSTPAGMTALTTAQMMQATSFSWNPATSGGAGTTWRIYNGNTMPLIESLLIPLTISASNQAVTYNGTNQDAAVLSYSLASPNLSAITGLGLTTAQHATTTPPYTENVSSAAYSTNYDLSFGATLSATLTIDPATLTPTLTNSGVTKIYNGTTAAPAGFTPTYSFSGLISGDTGATLANTGAAYNSAHVASANQVTVSGLSISSITGSNGSLTTDYSLSTSTASVAASITPETLTATLTNSGVTKVYNGSTVAPVGFTPAYSLSGLVSGDTGATLTDTGAAYNSAHVASANEVVVSGLSLGSITGSDGSLTSDYSLASSNASVAASITPATLTATLTNSGVTKVYDGTTNAPTSFTPTYSLTGLVSGDTDATLSDTGAAYNNLHVAGATDLTLSGLGIGGITGSNGSLASDYSLASTNASVAASITPAPLTVSLGNTTNVTKTYDGTTAAPSGFSPAYTIVGLVSGDTASVGTAATPVFNSAHVVSATAITLGGLSLTTVTGNGTDNSVMTDYTLANTTASTGAGVASITPLVLTTTAPTIGGVTTKIYDGTTFAIGATLNGGSVSGELSGDTLALDTSGIMLDYNSSHVASANNIGASGSLAVDIVSSTNGSQATDYSLSLPTIASVPGTITQALLTASLSNSGVTKTYDGTTNAPLGFTPTYSLTGLVSGDTGATLFDTGAAYNSAHVASATQLAVSGLSISGITGSNGSQASDYILSTNSAGVAASITPETLTATLTNTGVTKVYDGSTVAPAGFTPTYSISGLLSGDSAGLSDTGVAYNSAHVASANQVTVSGLSISSLTGSDGSQISDYSLASSSASAAASITPATLTATLTNTGVTKIYDGTTNAPAGFTPTYSLTGLVSGDTDATLSDTGEAYNSLHVVGATDLTLSGLGIGSITGSNGSLASDYSLASANASVAASITPAPLTVSLGNTTNVVKTYDGTTAAPSGFSPTYVITGLVSGDSATVGTVATPVFNSAHVISATAITQGGLSLTTVIGNGTDNSVMTDYTLANSTASTGLGLAGITPLGLTATAPTIGGTLTKVYDGTTLAVGATLSGGSVSGALTGDTLALDTSGIMLNYNSSHVTSASNIGASGTLAVDIVSSTNGSQPTDYSVSLPSIASVVGAITPAPLIVSLSNTGVTKIYNGTTAAPVGFTPTYDILGLVFGDAINLSDTGVAYNSAHVASATALTVSGLSISSLTGSNGSQISDYNLVSTNADVAATITPATLTATLTNTGVTKIYDGSTAAPVGFTPTYSLGGLISGDTGATLADTGVAYNSAHVLNANQVTVSGLSISGMTGSNGSLATDYTLAAANASVAATITPLALTATAPTIGGITTKVYDGTTAATGATLNGGGISGALSGDTLALDTSGVTLAYNSDHAASASSIGASGNLALDITSSSNGSLISDYTVSLPTIAPVAATITPAPLTVGLTNSGVSKIYDGTTATPVGFTPMYSIGGLLSGDSVDLSDTGLAYNSAHVASANEVVVSGLGISSVTGSNGSLTTDYSLASSNANVAATITPATLTATLTNSGVTKVYDGTTSAPAGFAPTYSFSGLVSGDTGATLADTGTAYNSAQVLGANQITVSGLSIGGIAGGNGSLAGDYSLASGSASVAAGITPALLTAGLTGSISKVYDGTAAATLTSANYLLSGFVNGQGATVTQTSGTYNSSNVANATTVTTTLGGADFVADSGTSLSNYTLPTSASGAANITPASLLVTANNASKTYDGAAFNGGNGVVYSGFVNGEGASVLGGTLTYGGNAQGAVNAGFYTITPSGLSSGNYTINYDNGTLTVNPAMLTATLTGTVGKVYDGTTAATLSAGNYTLTGVVGSDEVNLNDPTSGSYATANSGHGIDVEVSGLTIGGSGAGNYLLSNSTATAAVGTIAPAPLTVTANNASTVYSAQAYSGGNGVTYNGFVDGQTTAVLGGALTYAGNSQGALNVGSYALTPAGLTADNYSISYVSGTLAITPATLTYVATPAQVYTGQAIPQLTGTVTGFQGSDTLASATTGALTFSTPATAQSPAGQYAIAGNGLAANDSDYVFVQAAGNALAFDVLAGSGGVTTPGLASVQQQLGQPAPTVAALSPGALLLPTVAASNGSSPAATPMVSAQATAGSDLYAPDVRVVGGGVRLP